MKLKLLVCLFAVAALIVRAEEPKFESIFNGKDLAGWKVPAENKWWSVADGMIVCQSDPTKKGSTLATEKLFKDVVVEVEARWNGDVDSGIFLRKGEQLQCQIGVSRSLKKDMTCSIYVPKGGYKGHEAQGTEKLLKVGDWNKIRFEARGSNFKISLNGEQVLTWESDQFPDAGPIGLQLHGGVDMKIEFRNLKAAELK